MRVLITGVAGFIGSAIARRAVREGHEVVGLDSLTTYYDVGIKRRNLDSIPTDTFTFVNDAIETVDRGIFEGHDVVYHQAGQPGVRKSWGQDFAVYTQANISATQVLLETLVTSKSRARVVYASSSSVYGNAENFPTHESVRPQPLSPYGVTKLAAEHLVSLYAANYGVDAISLRYFTVYGPGQRPDMAFTRFLKAAVTGERITLYGTGEQIRDFTFIDDVVEANWLAGTSEVEPGRVFNVAGGSSVSVNQAIEIIEGHAGHSLDIVKQPAVKGDAYQTGGDTEAIQRALGWAPGVDIAEGLERHYRWAHTTFAPNSGTS